MTDAINAKSDVLGERELDAVSGGMSGIPWVASKVLAASKGTDGRASDGGEKDPAKLLFQKALEGLPQG